MLIFGMIKALCRPSFPVEQMAAGPYWAVVDEKDCPFSGKDMEIHYFDSQMEASALNPRNRRIRGVFSVSEEKMNYGLAVEHWASAVPLESPAIGKSVRSTIAAVKIGKPAVLAVCAAYGLQLTEKDLEVTGADEINAHLARRSKRGRITVYRPAPHNPELWNLDKDEWLRFKG